MKVAEGMSERVLMIGPAHTLREAARMIAARLAQPWSSTPNTRASASSPSATSSTRWQRGKDPDTELAAQHCTQDLVYAARDWTLEEATVTMVHGGFRHLMVVEGHEVIGLLSMRDIVRVRSMARVPSQAAQSDTLVTS
jgi:signal-transduction protein with cAMP-binding, CBS, and nucleotidyltransferase domain